MLGTGLGSPFSLFLAVTVTNIFSFCKVFSHMHFTDSYDNSMSTGFVVLFPFYRLGKRGSERLGFAKTQLTSQQGSGATLHVAKLA